MGVDDPARLVPRFPSGQPCTAIIVAAHGGCDNRPASAQQNSDVPQNVVCGLGGWSSAVTLETATPPEPPSEFAYHFQAALEGRAVNTKDADLVVHPAGNVTSCQQMASRLIALGWIRTEECYPRPNPDPPDDLRAIRLYPPGSHDYFLEFLNVPQRGQMEAKRWVKIQMDDGWYGLPSFRFLGVTALNRLKSIAGLEYASPAMMALANLLSHPEVGTARIESVQCRASCVLRKTSDELLPWRGWRVVMRLNNGCPNGMRHWNSAFQTNGRS